VPVSLLQCRQGRARGFGIVYAYVVSGDVVVFYICSSSESQKKCVSGFFRAPPIGH
jgi:hypothetical protein